jgi:hypothetical protein
VRVVLDDGSAIDLGVTGTTPTVGIIDYSRRVTDDFGVTTVVERGFARTMSVRLAVPFGLADEVQRNLARLRATPAMWAADDRFASLAFRGFYKDFSIDVAMPPLSYCTLTVEGLADGEAFVDPGLDPAPVGLPSTLQLIQPIDVSDAVLAASNMVENDYPRWGGGITYAAGARVIVPATHRIYESIVDGNVGADPAAGGGKWLDVGPTNRWAMFDQALGSATTSAIGLDVTLNAGAATALALLDVVGAWVRVRTGSYDRTIAVGQGAVTFLDLPGGGAPIRVTVDGNGSVSVGTLLVGRLVSLGVTEAGPTASITDYSRKEVDDFGEVTVVQRAWSKKMAAKALIDTAALDVVSNRIAAVRARPSLWIGQSGIDCLTIYGFFKDFSIEVGETVSKLSLSIEGLSQAAKLAPLGTAVNWGDIADPAGTKPHDRADVTADNKAKDTAAVGGRPAQQILDAADQIAPIKIDVSALKEARVASDASLAALRGVVADQDAAQRLADQAAGRLQDTILRSVLESTRTRDVLRDAGIVVDPADGKVRIFAIDQLQDRTSSVEQTVDAVKSTLTQKATVNYVNERIALAVLNPAQVAELEPIISRLTQAESEIDGLNAQVALRASAAEVTTLAARTREVEIDVDALQGEIALKASTAVVDQLGLRASEIEQKLVALPDTAGLVVTVGQVRGAVEAGGEGLLRTITAGETAARYQVSQIAQARQELTTRMDDGFSAAALARTSLSAQIAQANAALVAEAEASATRDGALTRRLDAQGVTLGDQVAAIGRLDQARIDAAGGIAASQMTIRQMIGAAGSDADALLRTIAAGEIDGQNRAAQLVEVTTQFTTTLLAGQQSEAIARQAILARLGGSEAAIVTTSRALADAQKAFVSRQDALEAQFTDATTGLVATRARIVALATLQAEQNKVVVGRLDLMDVQLADPATGAPISGATIAADRKAAADANSARVRDISQLRADVFEGANGLPAVSGRIDREAELSLTRDSALGIEVTELAVEVHDPDTGLAAAFAGMATDRRASVDRDNANLAAIERLSATVNDPNTGLAAAYAGMTTDREASVTRDKANTRAIEDLSAVIHDASTGLPATRASVLLNKQAQVDGDRALAESLQQVTTTQNGHTTTINLLLRTVDGQGGVAKLTIDNNGKIDGFMIDGEKHEFTIATDRLIVGNSKIFEVDTTTGQTVVASLKAGIVTARELAASAVMQTRFRMTTADIIVNFG